MKASTFKSSWMTLDILSESPRCISLQWKWFIDKPSGFGQLTCQLDPNKVTGLWFSPSLSEIHQVSELEGYVIFNELEERSRQALQEEYKLLGHSVPKGQVEIQNVHSSEVSSSPMVFRFLARTAFDVLAAEWPLDAEKFDLIREKSVTEVAGRDKAKRQMREANQ